MNKRKRQTGTATKQPRTSFETPFGPIDMNDSTAVTRYLVDMIDQLETIARARNHDLLAYLLAMAGVQAGSMETGGGVALPKRSLH